jgi:hypothetical protein
MYGHAQLVQWKIEMRKRCSNCNKWLRLKVVNGVEFRRCEGDMVDGCDINSRIDCYE